MGETKRDLERGESSELWHDRLLRSPWRRAAGWAGASGCLGARGGRTVPPISESTGTVRVPCGLGTEHTGRGPTLRSEGRSRSVIRLGTAPAPSRVRPQPILVRDGARPFGDSNKRTFSSYHCPERPSRGSCPRRNLVKGLTCACADDSETLASQSPWYKIVFYSFIKWNSFLVDLRSHRSPTFHRQKTDSFFFTILLVSEDGVTFY